MSRAGAALVAALGTGVTYGALRMWCPGGAERFERTSFSGRTVTLLEGPAVAVGLAAGAVATGRAAGRSAVLAAALAPATLGLLDDLVGTTTDKGLRGHLGALRRGEVTTGALKAVGLVGTGAAVALLTDGRPRSPVAAATTATGAAVVAGAANAINLFDLRPGRALKVTLLAAAPLAAGPGPAAYPAAVTAGAAVAALPGDLGARSMLGDTGANALGAVLGAALVQRVQGRGRAVALAVLAGLTLASERVSFTAVIERTAWLRAVDQWGRG